MPEFDESNPPPDVFGMEIKDGQVVAYAVNQGRSPTLRFAEVITAPYRNKDGKWRIRIQDIYSPQSHGQSLHPTDIRKTVIDAPRRVFIQPYSVDEARARAKIVDAELRLAGHR